MFDLTILDYVYVAVVLASTIWATLRGGIYETIATASWVIAAIAARFASPVVDRWLQMWFDLPESTVGTLVASYFVVFFIILLLVGFVNQKLRDRIQQSVMRVMDRTLGVLFGIVRGIVVMGVVYWVSLWYYSDAPALPKWLADARTRPVMQVTAVKLDEWFVPGDVNKLLARDMAGTREAIEIYNNLINPAIAPAATDDDAETGYKSSERTALENQLMQIESAARAAEVSE